MTMPLAIKALYIGEMAFWSSSGIFLFLETKRKDFYEMLVHHIATVVLIGISYTCNYWRVGMVVLLLHDPVDVLLYSAKSCIYSVWPSVLSDTLFGLFALSFLVLRLVWFPVVCVVAPMKYWEWQPHCHWRYEEAAGSTLLPFMLSLLTILHIFWFILISKMIVKVIVNKGVEKEGDIRSEDGSDADDETTRNGEDDTDVIDKED
mmetsp:Transcript_10638/g.25802  ORF Transcript_10638/g.25802 Transcript_10638/m.25802 type:complete len:205 (+) Transcript_10638:203-817(+)